MTADELSHFCQYDVCVPVAATLYTASLAYIGVCCHLWCTYLETLLIVQFYYQGLDIPCHSACMLCKLACCLLTQLVCTSIYQHDCVTQLAVGLLGI